MYCLDNSNVMFVNRWVTPCLNSSWGCLAALLMPGRSYDLITDFFSLLDSLLGSAAYFPIALLGVGLLFTFIWVSRKFVSLDTHGLY